MKSFRDRNPYAVGLISIGIIGVIVGIAFAVGLLHLLEKTYTMRGEFRDAAGIRGGDEVKVAGVRVGRVTKVEADRDDGLVIITWVVNDGIDLGPETRADIALETLLGSKYLRLSGPVEEPYMADLPPEDRIIPCNGDGGGDVDGVADCDRTSTPVDVFELTKQATEQIQETDTERLNQLINQLADVTEGKADTVRDLVRGIDEVAGALNERDSELRSLLAEADELSALLAEKDETLLDLIDASDRVLDLIVSRRDQLALALGEGSNAVDALSRVLVEHKDDIDRILDTLHPTVALLDEHRSEVNTALAYLGPGFYQQTAAGTHGPWLDVYIRSLGPDVASILDSALAELAP